VTQSPAPAPIRIAVTMACFNRRETTLRCLRSLMPQQTDDVRLDVYLVDDASPDGTGDAVRAAFPDVHVLTGTGNLFWGGGMHMAMTEAVKHPYDFVLWLNDDVELKPDAIGGLLSEVQRARESEPGTMNIMVGAVTAPGTTDFTYAAFKRTSRLLPTKLERITPKGDQATLCDTMNGNCVLIPRQVVERIGTIDKAFPHQLGDIDYGYRAIAVGANILLAPASVGECAPNVPMRRKSSLGKRLRELNTPRGFPPRPWVTFMWRHGGPLAVLHFGAVYGRYALFGIR
jgi:GT2 family glycosyltransferase